MKPTTQENIKSVDMAEINYFLTYIINRNHCSFAIEIIFQGFLSEGLLFLFHQYELQRSLVQRMG